MNREVLERVIPTGITSSSELQLRSRIRRSHGADVTALKPGISSKVATDGPFEAVLGKTHRTEFYGGKGKPEARSCAPGAPSLLGVDNSCAGCVKKSRGDKRSWQPQSGVSSSFWKSGVSSSFWKKSGVSSSFLPEKMNRHRITCGSTPDYVRLDTGLRAARRYYEVLRLPDVPLAALRFLRLAIPSLRPSFVPDGPGHGAVDPPGVGKPGLRPAFRWRRQGLPSSRGTLVIIRHVLRPRWDQAG